MRKKQKQNIIVAVIALAFIGGITWYGYSAEQTRQAGFVFGNELLEIQEGVSEQQSEFVSHITRWEEGDLTEEELADFANGHFKRMGELISRYDSLAPPETFGTAVEVFRLSSESQLESDREYLLWIQTGDEAHRVRSDALIQESFEYETAALGEFNRAKLGIREP